MDKTVFIYALRCPITGDARYVGKSVDPTQRFYSHLSERLVNHRTNWIKSLKSIGQKPVLEILDEVPASEWPQWEVAWIEFFRDEGARLVNSTSGGEGVEMTEEIKNKLRKPKTEAWKEKLRLANLGKRHTEEQKAKIGAAGRGRKDSPETAAKRSAVHLGKTHSPERCAINSAAQKKWWAENRQIAKRKPRTAEHCANLSLGRKEWWRKRKEKLCQTKT